MTAALQADFQVDVQVDDEFVERVDDHSIVLAVTETLRHQNLATAQLTVVITNDAQVQSLNAQFRQIDAPTDVLSFSNQEDTSSADPQLILPPDLLASTADYLGDIVIAYPYAARQAARQQNPLAAELRLLAIHGTLHLLGYDHATAAEEAAMWAIQDAVLLALSDPPMAQRKLDDCV